MPTPSKIRVRQHRARLRSKRCGRLEVWIKLAMIQKVRQVATRKHVPMWNAVEDALEAYVTGHTACDGRPEPA